jgi:hypothetical protein
MALAATGKDRDGKVIVFGGPTMSDLERAADRHGMTVYKVYYGMAKETFVKINGEWICLSF